MIIAERAARLEAEAEFVLTQITELERERDAVMEAEASDKASKMIKQLTGLRGIGFRSATVLVRDVMARHWDHTPVWRPRYIAAGSTASRVLVPNEAQARHIAAHRQGIGQQKRAPQREHASSCSGAGRNVGLKSRMR